jgi:hypothetical protein
MDKKLNKKDLYERSISKSEALKLFFDMAEEIVEHIFKLFIYQNSPNYDKWKNEIATFAILSESYTIIRSSNEKLNQSDYFKAMYDFIETEFDKENKYNLIISKYKLNAIRREIKNIEEPIPYIYFIKYMVDITNTINDISVYLSQNKKVLESDIILIINKNLPKFY